MCGGGAGGSFSDLAAVYIKLPTTTIVRHYRSRSPHPLCILNVDRRICTARTRPPIETLTSLSSVDVAMHIVCLHRR